MREVRERRLLRVDVCPCYGVCRRDRESVSWGERSCSGVIWRVVAAFVERNRRWGNAPYVSAAAFRCYEVWRWDHESVSWGKRGCSDRMRRVVAVFVEGGVRLGRWSVRVGCCVSQVVVVMEGSRGIEMVSGWDNDGVAIEYVS